MKSRRLDRLALFTFTLLPLTACQPEPPTMTPEETSRIETLTARMTPRCVGRYLIDLPAEFVLNPIHQTLLEGVEITVEPMKRYLFEDFLDAHRETLRKERIMGEETPSLTAALPLSDGAGYVFNRSRNRSGKVLRKLELVAFKTGYKIEMAVDARDMSQVDQIRENDTRRTDVQEKLAHLLKVYSRVRGRADHEWPSEPGVCFANGFLQGAPTDEEQVDLHYHLGTAEDVYFAFHSLSNAGSESDTLLDRGAAIERFLKGRNGRTLRKGTRESHGLKFEEWLSMMESDPGVADYYMTLEMNSKAVSAQAPLFVMDLNSGVRHPRPPRTLEEVAVQQPLAKASFGAAETMALWDKVAPTLRPRPANGPVSPVKPVTVTPPGTADAAPPQPEAPRLPLGTTAPSHQRCAQAGMWECAVTPTLGAKRYYFPDGWTFPQIAVRGPERTLWQKIRGYPTDRLADTTWTLVSYDVPTPRDDDGDA